VIQSEVVLGKVVEKLDLASEWRKKRAVGDRLKPVEAIGLLKRQMDLRPVRNTELIEIGVSRDDAAEAAKLANTTVGWSRANSRLVEIVDSAIAPAKSICPKPPSCRSGFPVRFIIDYLRNLFRNALW